MATWDGDELNEFPDQLVEDLITELTIGWLAGESQAGKTFLVVYLLYCIALGVPFFGKKTYQGGAILVAAEAGTIPGRKKAAHEGYVLPLLNGEVVFDDVAASLRLARRRNSASCYKCKPRCLSRAKSSAGLRRWNRPRRSKFDANLTPAEMR
jgi:AAA domain